MTTPVGRERWQEGIDLERAEWDTLAWQRGDHERHAEEGRFSKWERRLALLGLSLSSFRGQHLLDVGCGPTGLVYFVDAARRVGVDPLADQYAKWNGHWGEPIELVRSEAESMPFEDGAFDTVSCTNCLDHTRDPAQVVGELARVMRPGGLLILHTDLDSPLRKLHKRVRFRAGAMHPHSLTYGWLHGQLEPHFSIEAEARDPEVFRPTRRQMRYEAYWDGLLHRLTRSEVWLNHIWIRAEKA